MFVHVYNSAMWQRACVCVGHEHTLTGPCPHLAGEAFPETHGFRVLHGHFATFSIPTMPPPSGSNFYF